MVKVVWAEPALRDLDAIADYIALDNPHAARELVHRVFAHVEQLAARSIELGLADAEAGRVTEIHEVRRSFRLSE